MAGGFKQFGPTYNTTPYVRLGYEGILNGTHNVDVDGVDGVRTNYPEGDVAGRFASISKDGVGVASEGGANAIGLFREDLGDMQNASAKATFYFRGGEYYVALGRTGLVTPLEDYSVKVNDTERTAATFDDTTTSGVVETYTDVAGLEVGQLITSGANGEIILYDNATATNKKPLGVITHLGPYTAGNMYQNAGAIANAGDFVGFILFI
jgi:hypothetical protein